MHVIPGVTQKAADGISLAREYFDSLALEGAAHVEVNEPRGDIYYDVTIEGSRFQAVVASDPYITRKDRGDWCQLGVASIQEAGGPGSQNDFKKWMVCKYSASEGRIDISQLSAAGRRALSITFGIPIGVTREFHESYAFYASSAFDGLVEWAKRRPRKFKAEVGISNYVGDWKTCVNACITEKKA